MVRRDVAAACVLVLMTGGACRSESDQTSAGADDGVVTVKSALTPADCNATLCPDVTAVGDGFGRWPGGKIFYALDSTDGVWKDDIRRAMDDWERMTGGKGVAIEFKLATAPGTLSAPVVTIRKPTGVEGAPGFMECRTQGACNASMAASAYHELGHIIGFQHHFGRYDSRHYLAHTLVNGTCEFFAGTARTSIPTNQNIFDHGPFDYLSTEMYGFIYPQFYRWDQSPMMPGAVCGTAGPTVSPPSCSSTFCTPTCQGTCTKNQPQGFPTFNDASWAVELYRNLSEPGWYKFQRTVDEVTGAPGVSQPFDYDLAAGVIISATASPAVAYDDNPVIFVTGDDGNIYRKTRSGTGWSAWSNLGKPGISGTVSDPAAVSWGSGRMDVVVTRGDIVYIKTNSDSWQSLSDAASFPPSAPSAPAISSWGPDRLDVFVRGNNNRLYWRNCTANCNGASGVWSNWDQVAGILPTISGTPAAVSRTSGSIDVFAAHATLSGALRRRTLSNGTWSAWSTVSTPGLLNSRLKSGSSPAAGSRKSNAVDVYVKADDNKIWTASCPAGGSCGTFAPLGGNSSANPAAVTRGSNNNRADVVINMAEERARPDVNTVQFKNGLWWKRYDMGHTFPTQVALAPNTDGRLEAIYTSANDVVYQKWQSPPPNQNTWNGPTLAFLSNDRAKQVALGVTGNGLMSLISIDADGILNRRSQSTPGGGFYFFGLVNPTLSAASDMALARNDDGTGRLQLVYVGPGGTLYQTAESVSGGSWNNQQLLDQSFTTGKRVVMASNTGTTNKLEMVFVDSNDNLQRFVQSAAGGSTWTGGILTSPAATAKRLAIAQNATQSPGLGRLELVFIGLDNVLYDTSQTSAGGSWGPAHFLDQSFTTGKELAVARNSTGQLEVVFTDTNDVVQHLAQTVPGGTTWTGGVLTSPPVTAKQLALSRDAAGNLVLIYVGMDDAVYRTRQTAGHGSSWTAPTPL